MSDAERNAIIEKHANSLMAELRGMGLNPVGIAGGVVFDNADHAHVFFVADDGIYPVNGGPFDGGKFIRDVASTMLSVEDVEVVKSE